MSIYCPTCSEGDCQEHSDEPHSYTVPDAAHTSPHDVTVTYYTTEGDAPTATSFTNPLHAETNPETTTVNWYAAPSSCGTDHGGVPYDLASSGVTVLRMVPDTQVESLRETVSDLYRQLGDEKRRVAALETALREAEKGLRFARPFVSGYNTERPSESLLHNTDAPLELIRYTLLDGDQ